MCEEQKATVRLDVNLRGSAMMLYSAESGWFTNGHLALDMRRVAWAGLRWPEALDSDDAAFDGATIADRLWRWEEGDDQVTFDATEDKTLSAEWVARTVGPLRIGSLHTLAPTGLMDGAAGSRGGVIYAAIHPHTRKCSGFASASSCYAPTVDQGFDWHGGRGMFVRRDPDNTVWAIVMPLRPAYPVQRADLPNLARVVGDPNVERWLAEVPRDDEAVGNGCSGCHRANDGACDGTHEEDGCADERERDAIEARREGER